MTRSEDYAAELARLTADLVAERDETVTGEGIVQSAQDFLPSAEHVSITVQGGRRHRTLASTGPLPSRCDSLQYELGDGPCVEALHQHDWYRSGDVAHDPRWVTWGPAAAREGVNSVLSVRLVSGGEAIGALNLYAVASGEFADKDEVELAFLFATHAAAALGAAQEITGLQTAMHSRHTIGVAQGILMNRYDLDLDRSFELLRRYSTTHNIKLRELAAYVVEHHRLPAPTTG